MKFLWQSFLSLISLGFLGLMAGKWPHSLALQPGGSTRTIGKQDQIRLIAIIAGFRQFLEQNLFDLFCFLERSRRP